MWDQGKYFGSTDVAFADNRGVEISPVGVAASLAKISGDAALVWADARGDPPGALEAAVDALTTVPDLFEFVSVYDNSSAMAASHPVWSVSVTTSGTVGG